MSGSVFLETSCLSEKWMELGKEGKGGRDGKNKKRRGGHYERVGRKMGVCPSHPIWGY